MSFTTWTRVEPLPQDPTMPGFAARVADPLWLLARQWQLEELTARNCGSPVRVDLTVQVAPLTRYRPRLPDGIAGEPLDTAAPLEALVEAEPAAAPERRGSTRDAALTGARMLTLLGPLGATLREAMVATHPIAPAPAGSEPAVARRVDLLRRQVPDGRTLYTALAGARAAGDPTTAIPGLDRNNMVALQTAREAALTWLDWYTVRPVVGGGAPPAWRPERLDHEFTLGAPGATAADETVLVAPDHDGGEIDWWSFSVQPRSTVGAIEPAPPARQTTTLPTGLTLAGLPASRFWEFENGDVNLDAVSAAPEDLGRLLFTEFAVAYGNDFFLVPVTVDAASVTTVRALSVRTTFGETIDIPTADRADADAGRAPFRLYRPSIGTVPGTTEAAAMLVVVPNATGRLAGETVEDVLLTRDEMANVAWAIERRVPGVDGRGTDRAEALQRTRPDPPEAGGSPHPPAPRYRLVTYVPPNWLPMLPQATDSTGTERPVLRLSGPAPAGQLLLPGGEVNAERLPRSGVVVTRRAQRARGADGRTFTWTARQRATGTGTSSSGLRFDDLTS